MKLSTDLKNEIITKFGKDENDSGSAEVQVALLTRRIRELTEHAKEHKKDKHSQHGLVKLVAQRKKMMKYLRRTNPDSYLHIIKELTIRG
ncbi:MAG: 30S ribosomal protein S15 [Candidatus Neomarinimicrobiota bacterium]